ncbi:hypothetical protein ACJJTC_015060 [Scirpophaga incertulas]
MYDQPPAPVQPRALVGAAPCAHSLTSLTICEGAGARLAMYDQPPAPCSPEPRWCCPLCTQSYIPNYLLTSLTICEGRSARLAMYDQPPRPVQPRALVGVAPCAHSLTSLTICEGAARGSPCTTSRPPRAAPSPRWCCPLCTQSYIPNYL